MLSKKERLTRAEFDRCFSLGKRFHTPFFQLIVTKSGTFHGSVVVGKKVYKNAVDRNKLKRRLYAVLYTFSKQNPLPHTYIVIAKPTAKTNPLTLIRSSLVEALENSIKNL